MGSRMVLLAARRKGTVNVLIVTIGKLTESVCFECKQPLEDKGDLLSWMNFQAIYKSRRGHNYCHKCYKRWLPGLPAVIFEHTQKAGEFVEACGTLGIDPESSWEEIADVYRVKAKRAHPDAGGDPERFKRLNNAFEAIKKVKGGKVL